jgi:Tfp pilus assembly protein PilZ
MAVKKLTKNFADIATLEKEFEDNLRAGGTFVPAAHDVVEHEDCDVILIHPTDKAQLTIPARVVWVAPPGAGEGVGVAFSDFASEDREKIAQFIKEHAKPKATHETAQQRMRGLSAAQQQKVARQGELGDRVVLERIYGKFVWEPLLRNPRISVPEVARIARMGTLPRPLIELIVSNRAWLSGSPVRRALLSNPRVSADLVKKILAVVPPNELRLMAKQTAYSQAVRQAARRLLL